jgi:hypothetical protein
MNLNPSINSSSEKQVNRQSGLTRAKPGLGQRWLRLRRSHARLQMCRILVITDTMF